MKYTSRADLLISAGESIKMQNKYSINPVCKVYGELRLIEQCSFMSLPVDIEFPLAVVEGKPVFVGDELYSPEGKKFTVCEYETCAHLASWNPPKPATVMVELLREDAEWFVARATTDYWTEKESIRTADACRKALEKA